MQMHFFTANGSGESSLAQQPQNVLLRYRPIEGGHEMSSHVIGYLGTFVALSLITFYLARAK